MWGKRGDLGDGRNIKQKPERNKKRMKKGIKETIEPNKKKDTGMDGKRQRKTRDRQKTTTGSRNRETPGDNNKKENRQSMVNGKRVNIEETKNNNNRASDQNKQGKTVSAT